MLALPISMPQTQVMVYGIELTGETPKLDLTDRAMPDGHDEETDEIERGPDFQMILLHALRFSLFFD